MKIFTGNFANIKKYQKIGLLPISIARYNSYYHGIIYPQLAPPSNIIRMEEHFYRPIYEGILNGLDPFKTYKELEQVSDGKNIVLLCYEREGEFCHRQIVAEWFNRTLKIEVKELGRMDTPKTPQQTLF